MALQMQALCVRIGVPYLKISVWRGGNWSKTHNTPVAKTAVTPNFLFILICSFNTQTQGTSSITMSETRLKQPEMVFSTTMLMQWPGNLRVERTVISVYVR